MTTRYVPAGFALALCLHFLTTADSAKAEDVDLTDVIGGACVPDSATVRAGLYETAGFGVRFGSGTGRIRLLCPYHLHSDAIGSRIGITMMSFIDQDGMEVGRGSAPICASPGWEPISPSPSARAIPTPRASPGQPISPASCRLTRPRSTNRIGGRS